MTVSRITLPNEFYELTSAKMLLPPEPQYFWANLLFGQIRAAELAKNAGQPYTAIPGQPFPSGGADVPDIIDTGPALNDAAPAYPDAIVVEDFTAQPGHTVRMNRLVFADTTYTTASRRVQRQTIGTAGADITGEQTSITIERYAGPLVAAAGAVGPHIIDEFDAKRMPVHALSARVGVHLRRDRFKFVDTVTAALACSGALTTQYVYPGDPNNTLTSDSTAFPTGSTGTRPWDLESCFRAEQVALSASIPTFANGRYLGSLSPIQARQLQTNSRFEKMTKFYREKNPIFQHYLGTIGMTDWFVSNTNPTASANSVTIQTGVLMGPGALAYANAMPCEVRADPTTNYGQQVRVVWLADEGFERLDNRFLVSLRSG